MSKKQSIFVNVYLGVDQFVESQEVDRKYGGGSLCQQYLLHIGVIPLVYYLWLPRPVGG